MRKRLVLTRELRSLEKHKNKLSQQAEVLICKKIADICKKKNWSMKSVYGVTVYTGGNVNGHDENSIQLYDTEIHKLIYWYEDTFERFGLYANEAGRWLEGQTPLIVFNKPKMK